VPARRYPFSSTDRQHCGWTGAKNTDLVAGREAADHVFGSGTFAAGHCHRDGYKVVDVDPEFIDACPADGMVRQLARLDMSADEVPTAEVPPTRVVMYQEHEPSRTSAATEVGIWATMAAL
jgi:hypothetical protein